MSLSREQRADLVIALQEACGSGAAEAEPTSPVELRARFHPVVGHLRVLDPEARLVIGDKGSGKTQLFQVLRDNEARRALILLAEAERRAAPPFERTDWLVGYSLREQSFPPPQVIDPAVRRLGEQFQTVWLAFLAHQLVAADLLTLSQLHPDARPLLAETQYDLEAVVEVFQRPAVVGSLFQGLDKLDKTLAQGDRWVIVTYDELDLLSPSDWTVTDQAIGALVRFWSVQTRRYRRIQPKVFLRRDIFNRSATGPDFNKLALGGVELRWTAADLYGLLFKRILNGNPRLRQHLGRVAFSVTSDSVLGAVPTAKREQDYGRAVDRLFGKYMGPNPQKGLTVRWIPNHLKDGNGALFPRPGLQLIGRAAGLERDQPRADGTRLVHHTSLRGALDDVSTSRVDELTTQEFPWMREVRRRLTSEGLTVPTQRDQLVQILGRDWPPTAEPPPTRDGAALLSHLVELGIAQERRDGRIDVGDLYLSGLGLRRKGGVARPRVSGRR